MNTDRIVALQNQSVSNWHKGRLWKRVHQQILNAYPQISFAGAGLTAVNFVNIPFLILIGRFLLLNSLINADGRHKICHTLKASILSSVVLRKHGIFSFSSIRSLDLIDDLLDVW